MQPAVTQTEKLKEKSKVKKKTRSFFDAILIQPTEGKTFANILKNIRTGVKSENIVAIIRSIRQARKGNPR